MRKTPDKPQMRDILQNLWPGLLKTIKVIKTRQAGNHYSPEEPKEIQWLNEIGTWTGCWKRKRTLRRNSGNLSKVVNNNIINTGSLIIRETGYSWHGNSVLFSHFFCKSKIALKVKCAHRSYTYIKGNNHIKHSCIYQSCISRASVHFKWQC